MAIVFNESDILRESFDKNAYRQRLITAERMKGTNILLNKMSIEPGGLAQITVPEGSVVWFHVLEGKVVLEWKDGAVDLVNDHVTFLTGGEKIVLESEEGATLLYVEVPNVARIDPNYTTTPPRSRVLDWTQEPMLDSKHDLRRRIYMATPNLFGTRAIKCEMIFYPPQTTGSSHRHEGAEHFKYVLKGKGRGYADDSSHPLRQGDIVYHPAEEWHYSATNADEEVTFIEFFVPGVFKTTWATERICSWSPTGRNIRGGKPTREIAFHSGDQGTPKDV